MMMLHFLACTSMSSVRSAKATAISVMRDEREGKNVDTIVSTLPEQSFKEVLISLISFNASFKSELFASTESFKLCISWRMTAVRYSATCGSSPVGMGGMSSFSFWERKLHFLSTESLALSGIAARK